MTHDIIIVGAGLFGSIAATLAKAKGHNVTLVDGKHQYAASRASGCVLAPSWLSSLQPRQIDDAMKVLANLYEVEDIVLHGPARIPFKAQRVDPDKVLRKPDVVSQVLSVSNGKVELATGRVLRGKILVAAGAWCNELVDMPPIRGLYGASYRFTGAQLPEAMLSVYLPYRQAIGINLNKNTVWFGDGTALVKGTWLAEERERCEATRLRAKKILGKHIAAATKVTLNIGCRPYVEGFKAGYFKKVSKQNWVSTGGAKNGTVLAAWQALRFVEELP